MSARSARDPDRPLRVVSVSRGSSRRDARVEMTLLGRHVVMERIGTDGDVAAAARVYERLRDEVDAFGLGGADLELRVGGRSYRIRESAALAKHAGSTPVVCGVGLKSTLERRAVETLDAEIGWRGRRVLLPSAADRWGMAEALANAGARLTIGDFAFLLGLPIAMHDLSAFERRVRRIAPIVARAPMAWIYPTGAEQERAVTGWRARWFDEAEVVAGDWHLIARFAPHDLSGTSVLTNTTTPADLADLAARGARCVATTTPRIAGRSLPTNLLEAAFVAVAGRHPLPSADLEAMVAEAGLAPDVWRTAPPGAGGETSGAHGDASGANGAPSRPAGAPADPSAKGAGSELGA